MRDDWRRGTLAEVASEKGLIGGPFGSNLGRRDYVSTGVPVLRGQNLSSGRYVNYRDCVFVTEAKVQADLARNIAVPGDLIFTQRGTLGQVAIVPPGEHERAVISQSQMRLRVDANRFDPLYVYHYATSNRFLEEIENRAIVAGVPHINLGILASIPIPLPPLPEQRRIAGVLGALDDLIDTNQRLVRLLTDSIAVAFRVAAEATVDRAIPIGDLTAVVGGSTPKTGEPTYWDGPHAWATPRDLSRTTSIPLRSTERSITDDGLAKISSGALPVGTLLMSSRAPIGYLAIAEIPVAVNQGFIAMKQTDTGVSNVYLWQWLSHNMEAVHDRANGSTFQEISKVNFRPIEVAVPVASALATFETVAQPAYRSIVALENETNELRRTRDELLPLLMSGAVSPGEVEAVA